MYNTGIWCLRPAEVAEFLNMLGAKVVAKDKWIYAETIEDVQEAVWIAREYDYTVLPVIYEH